MNAMDKRSGRWSILTLMLTLTALGVGAARAAQDEPAERFAEVATTPTAARTPDQVYGYWVLLPAAVAIALAVLFRQVVPALIVGILTGAYMIAPHLDGPGSYGDAPGVIRGLRVAVETYLIGPADLEPIIDPASGHDAAGTYITGITQRAGSPRPVHGALRDVPHLQVVLFTLLIGAMVGILSANGGTAALVQSVSHLAWNRRRGQILGWTAGLVVFFDDYANCMIVGPTLRPVCDRLRISRQKLAYLVDSTAAPVASLALVGTWIGAEIDYIQSGLDDIGGALPDFLAGVSAYQLFLYSLPYRFYAIFTLLLVLLLGASGRDFGPMRAAEARAAQPSAHQAGRLEQGVPAGRWWYAGWPIVVLITVTLAILFRTGWSGVDAQRFGHMAAGEKLGHLLYHADAYASILYGAIAAVSLSALLTRWAGALTVSETIDAGLKGMAQVFPAVVVLVLAWTLSQIMQDLQLAQVAKRALGPAGLQFDAGYLPLAIFVTAAAVSFSTGTSWGTMGILCPLTVTVAVGLVADLPSDQAARLLYAAVGSVLAGAVFGDHCSPISDTTVLSALASGCSLESHVWTQLPYALTAAVVAMVCGDALGSHFHQPLWICLGSGAAVLVLVVMVLGRRPPIPVTPLSRVSE